MSKKFILLLLLMFVIQSSCFAMWGKEKGGDGGKSNEGQQSYRSFQHLSTELNLSNDQIREIDKLSIRYEKENLPVVTHLRELHIQMKELLLEDNTDQARIKELLREISRTELVLKERRVDGLFGVLKVLTPEQKLKLKDLRLFGGLMGGNMYDKPSKGSHQTK